MTIAMSVMNQKNDFWDKKKKLKALDTVNKYHSEELFRVWLGGEKLASAIDPPMDSLCSSNSRLEHSQSVLRDLLRDKELHINMSLSKIDDLE